MHIFKKPPRIAFVDLTFNWPPIGGCWIDTHHVIHGLQMRGATVCLFCPDFTEYYPRGAIQEPLPYPVEKIPFNRYSFNQNMVQKRFRDAVDSFGADLVFLTDGYHMKNHLMSALGAERCFLRFYSYEMLCINLHYYRYHESQICTFGYFEDPKECQRCWFRRMPAWGRAIQIALGMKEQHPKLHFSQEYLASLAFTKQYHETLMENFKKLGGAIVYNDFMKEKLSPYVDSIHIIPSGVNAEQFTPSQWKRESAPIKIFLPGRANDPLKGLDVLIQAGRLLTRQTLQFEVHYTAAMDCPTQEPWLINHGWVNQNRLAELYHEMDIVVVPSLWIEPFGITALEGMASGLPVIASNHGGLAKSVLDGRTGYLVPPGDAHALAEKLKTVIENSNERVRMGRTAREHVVQNYTWDHLIDEFYIGLIDTALKQL